MQLNVLAEIENRKPEAKVIILFMVYWGLAWF